MSTDRLRRVLAGGALAMSLGTMVAASGCRSTHNEVPPGPKYGTTGEPSSAPLGFNQAPHPYTSIAPGPYGNPGGAGQPGTGGAPGLGGGSPASPTDAMSGLGTGGASSFGTPSPNGNLGQPTTGLYGGPGTAGMGGPGR